MILNLFLPDNSDARTNEDNLSSEDANTELLKQIKLWLICFPPATLGARLAQKLLLVGIKPRRLSPFVLDDLSNENALELTQYSIATKPLGSEEDL